MRFRIFIRYFSDKRLTSPLSGVCALLLALSWNPSSAQTAATAPVNAASASKAADNTATAWVMLEKNQQVALSPLEKSWASLSEGQKRKWLAVAKTYTGLGAPEREKIHSRMVEWAALSPKEREAARLNFAHSKAVAESDRAANWEAYQALSPDERQKLAEGAKVKPVGAAVPVKPVSYEKLTPVPVTRHTPEQERVELLAKRPLNRKTLLPEPLPVSSVSAAAPDAGAKKP